MYLERRNVMVYVKPGEQMRMIFFQSVTQAYSEKEILSSPNRSRTYDRPITSSDALPLSYRRLVGAKAIKLGSCDKHPAYQPRSQGLSSSRPLERKKGDPGLVWSRVSQNLGVYNR